MLKGKKERNLKKEPRTRSRACWLASGTFSLISSHEALFLQDFNTLEKFMQLLRRRVSSCESPSSARWVFAFNTGLLWDHMNGAFLVLWHVLGGVGWGRLANHLFQESVGRWASVATKNKAKGPTLPGALEGLGGTDAVL